MNDRASSKKLTDEQLKCYDILRFYLNSQAFIKFSGMFVVSQEDFNTKVAYALLDDLNIDDLRQMHSDLAAAEQRLSLERVIRLNKEIISFNPEKSTKVLGPKLEELDEFVQKSVNKLVLKLSPLSVCIDDPKTISSIKGVNHFKKNRIAIDDEDDEKTNIEDDEDNAINTDSDQNS